MQAFCATSIAFTHSKSRLRSTASRFTGQHFLRANQPQSYRCINHFTKLFTIVINCSEQVNPLDEAFVTCADCGSDEPISATKILRKGSISVRCSQCQKQWVADVTGALNVDGTLLIECKEDFDSAKKYSGGTLAGNKTSKENVDKKAGEIIVKLYISGLPPKVDDSTLRRAFEIYGEVKEVNIPYDRVTGRSRGFAFVTIVGQSSAAAAIDDLTGSNFLGRRVKVREADR